MAKLNKGAKLERLALRAARLMKRCDKLVNRVGKAETEAAAAAEGSSELRLKEARRRVRAPLQQRAQVLSRLEAEGGNHLLDAAVKKVARRPRKVM